MVNAYGATEETTFLTYEYNDTLMFCPQLQLSKKFQSPFHNIQKFICSQNAILTIFQSTRLAPTLHISYIQVFLM